MAKLTESELALSELIWTGQQVEEESHLEGLRSVFLENLLKDEESQPQRGDSDSESGFLEKKIKNCKSHLERIHIVKEYFHWIPISTTAYTLFQKLGKNANLSTQFRERGNLEYKKSRLSSALRGYNLAISFGRPGQEECGLAYANRAALLLQINEPQLALRDVELAVNNQFPQNLSAKLEERKKKCEVLLEQQNKQTVTSNSASTTGPTIDALDDSMGNQNRKRSLNENLNSSSQNQSDSGGGIGEVNSSTLLASTSKRFLTDKEYCNQEFFTLKEPSESIIGAEKFVNIEATPERGRRVVVDRDVDAASVLLLEKPFVTMLEKELRWDVEHCQLCLKRVLSGIPCEDCSFAIYCDETCRLKAQKFHQYEHDLWIYMHGINSSRRDLLATRVVEILGPAGVLERYRQQSNNPAPTTPITAGFNQNGVYDPSTYEPLHQLISHSSTDSFFDVVSNAFKALVTSNFLKERTQFFNQMQDLIADKDKDIEKLFDFTASLILHHLENIPYNAISLNEFRLPTSNSSSNKETPENQENSIKSVSYAVAIFGLLSMCNHSCSPNAVHVRQTERGMTALVSLRPLKKDEEVCITYGPLFTVHEQVQRQALLKDKYNFECDCDACVGNWSSSVDFVSDKSEIDGVGKSKEDELREIHKLILEDNKYVDGMERIRPCLQYFGSNFPPYFSLTQVAQDLFKKALVNIVNKNHLNHHQNRQFYK